MAIEPIEIVEVKSHTIACDGGKGALGHPKVYLEIASDKSDVMCPYCSRLFVLKGHKPSTKAA